MRLRDYAMLYRGRLQGTSSTPGLDADMLTAFALGMSREDLLLMRDALPSDADMRRLEALIARREKGEPVAYIVGEKAFRKHVFFVTPDVLTPRPDSETLIDAALQRLSPLVPLRILDAGTGSGCLLLSLLTELPNAVGVGLDISLRAIRVAERNARRVGVSSRRAAWICGNWCDALADESFDVVISNPPYVAEKDRATLAPDLGFEPQGALFAGEDGLDAYEILAPQLCRVLRPEGVCVLEIGQGQEIAVAAIADDAGLRLASQEKDLAGVIRVLVFEKKFS
ncbi:MAG: peptide chain release factor N(5)-glutamine methyltransferase [Rickettsiales bacterium]